MIPTFPIEEERDDIHDWMTYFRNQMRERQRERDETATKSVGESASGTVTTIKENEVRGSINNLDVILMIQDGHDCSDDSEKHVFNRCSNASNQQLTLSDLNDLQGRDGGRINKPNIMGAVTIEYYRNSQVGLLGYIVLAEKYRGRGLGRVLHEEALIRMEMLANKYGSNSVSDTGTFKSRLRAIFAETNTPSAGDITPAECRERHQNLYNLGYRLVNFPYAQPPLDPKNVNSSFDDMMLLVYYPYHAKRACHNDGDNDVELGRKSKTQLMMRYCSWFFDEQTNGNDEGSNNDHSRSFVRMKMTIPFHYVEEFYQITFIHALDVDTDTSSSEDVDDDESEKSTKEDTIPDYRKADFYKLAHWFTHHRQQEPELSEGSVEISLYPPSTTPWEDIKETLLPEWKEWQDKEERKNKPQESVC
jgi:GNAT superfamily N-acetyltransferase